MATLRTSCQAVSIDPRLHWLRPADDVRRVAAVGNSAMSIQDCKGVTVLHYPPVVSAFPLLPSLSFEQFDQVADFFFIKVFYADKFVLGFAGQNQLVEFCLNCPAVAILRVLQDEHHQKGDDGRGGVDHQLPRFRKLKKRTRQSPNHDESCCGDKGGWLGCPGGNGVRETGEHSLLCHGRIPLKAARYKTIGAADEFHSSRSRLKGPLIEIIVILSWTQELGSKRREGTKDRLQDCWRKPTHRKGRSPCSRILPMSYQGIWPCLWKSCCSG